MSAPLELSDAGAALAELASDEIPNLHCLVARGDTVRADIVVNMPAGIVAGGTLHYFEVAATADSTAHAIAGALSESRVDAQWQIKGDPFSAEWKVVDVGSHVAIRDTRLEVPNFKGRLHHVAVLDTSGDLILANSSQTLWAKLRSRMSCPSLDDWGDALMPRLLRSNLLIPAQSWGIRNELKAYILAPDADATFDQVIANFVRQTGGLRANALPHGILMKEAA